MAWKTMMKGVEKLGAKKWIENELEKLKDDPEIKANVERVHDLEKILREAAPHVSHRLIGNLAIDLGDLVKVGSRHDRIVKEIVNLSGPKMKRRLEDLLVEVEVNLLFEALFHIKSLKKGLPKFQKALRKKTAKKTRKK